MMYEEQRKKQLIKDISRLMREGCPKDIVTKPIEKKIEFKSPFKRFVVGENPFLVRHSQKDLYV